jgi:glycosyltransferase involved in cell wall biosynthesis
LTGKDDIQLPENAFVCHGKNKDRKTQIISVSKLFQPDFVIINGYVGREQTIMIRYCQKEKIPYAIESDTPLHIPENKVKALLKKLILRGRLHHSICYGFPGGTLQKENLIYYGIPEEKNYIMPMSVSSERILCAAEKYPNKLELKQKLGFENKCVFLFVGRLAPEKNVSLLIEAYVKLKERRSDIALMIVGDGSEAGKLKRFVKEKRIEDVCFTGYVIFPELIQYYKMADVFVLPSAHEPWGLVVNEAMIMGLPVVVSDCVGCRVDLVKNGENGYVFENDSVSNLKEKMSEILDYDLNSVSEKANAIIAEWNYKIYLRNFIEVVDNVAN